MCFGAFRHNRPLARQGVVLESNAEVGLSLSNKQLCRDKPESLGLVQTQPHVNALVRSELQQGEGSQQLQKGTPLLQAETGAPHKKIKQNKKVLW